jgi:transposase InsO family protein
VSIIAGDEIPTTEPEVERSQKTDLEEFRATVDLASPVLEKQLDDWQVYYTEFRPHGSLRRQTPWER